MAIQKFEDIIAWQKAQDFAVAIYFHFNKLTDWGFKDQICRAVVSISNNIAAGSDRNSNTEFIRFLNISLASCSEVRSMLHLAFRLNFLSNEQQEQLLKQSIEITKIITGLIKSMKH